MRILVVFICFACQREIIGVGVGLGQTVTEVLQTWLEWGHVGFEHHRPGQGCCFQFLCRLLVKCKGPCVWPIITKQCHTAPQMFSYSRLPTLVHKKYLILILVEYSRAHPIG